MSDLYQTGIRPILDSYFEEKVKEVRSYGKYWSASSAGYCMRMNILKRLQIPSVPEIKEDELRTQRVFEAGHIFHSWLQGITKDIGISKAQELELQDEDLLVRGHIDDLLFVNDNMILYDFKTQNSQAFNYPKPDIGHYHKMQLATYLYMLRHLPEYKDVKEARILQISKDDLRLREQQLMWSPALEKEIVGYWKSLQGYWEAKTLPKCTCHLHDSGFMGKRSSKGKVYNSYFWKDAPCSFEWIKQFDEQLKGWKDAETNFSW